MTKHLVIPKYFAGIAFLLAISIIGASFHYGQSQVTVDTGKNTLPASGFDDVQFQVIPRLDLEAVSSPTPLSSSSGTLTAAFSIRHRGGNFLPFLVVRRIEPNKGDVSELVIKAEKSANKAIDPFNIRTIYDPQFSPDGHHVLFKFGNSTSFMGTYKLYVLDVVTKKVTLASKRDLSYGIASWSPDGKYVAFIEGGDAEGNTTALNTYLGPLRLYICDWQKKQDYLVAENDTLRGPFSWIAPHTLVYGMLSVESQRLLEKRRKLRVEQSNKAVGNLQLKAHIAEPRPDILSYSLDFKSSKILFKDGYLPIVSPDGKRVAFFGSERVDSPLPLLDGWERAPQGASLCVANIDGSSRLALNQEGRAYPFVSWLPTNQQLVTIQQTHDSPSAQAEIKRWDVTTRRFNSIASINAEDYIALPRSIIEPQFVPLAINTDSSLIFVYKNEYIGINKDTGFLKKRGTLMAVSLSSGKISDVVHTSDDSGVDWRTDEVRP